MAAVGYLLWTRLFSRYDDATCARSKGGSLDIDELGNVFETIGSALQRDELEDVMSDIDDSGDGEVRMALCVSLAAALTVLIM